MLRQAVLDPVVGQRCLRIPVPHLFEVPSGMTAGWVQEKAALRNDVARKSKCKACGKPVLKALAGSVAALHVQLDPDPLDYLAEARARNQGRLTWCLAGLLEKRIQWRHWRCEGHPVLADHVCQTELVRMVTLKDMARRYDEWASTRSTGRLSQPSER